MPSPAILIRAISNLKNAFQQQVKYRSRLTCQGPQHLSAALATVALVTELVGMKCTFCFSQKLPDLVQGRSFRTDFWVYFCRNPLADRPLFSLGPTSWSSHKEHSLCMGKNSWTETNAHSYTENYHQNSTGPHPSVREQANFWTLLPPAVFWSLSDWAWWTMSLPVISDCFSFL